MSCPTFLLLCSAHHEHWQPYPVDPYFCYMCGHTYTQNISIVHKIDTSSTTAPQYHFSYFISRDQILRRERGRGKYNFSATMATSRIGKHARLIHTPLKVPTYTNNMSWGIAEPKEDWLYCTYVNATMATSRVGNHARLIHTLLKVPSYTNSLSWGIAEQKTGYTVPMYT